MTALWVLVWLAVPAAALGLCGALARAGLPSTYVRDLLHVGAGTWVLGWPLWPSAGAPVALAACVAGATAAVPVLARRSAPVARIRDLVTGEDERWAGLTWYGLAYALGTAAAFKGAPFAPGAALLALSLGDGVGGAVGRRFGRLRFRAPGAKHKSLEGAVTVAVFASLGALVAARLFDQPLPLRAIALLGAVAALAEALAPRGTDNAVVPLCVWLAAEGLT